MVRIVPDSIKTTESFSNSSFVFNNLDINTIDSDQTFGTALLDISTFLQPNYVSAIILNNLVKAYNITVSQLISAEKIKNFCIGGTASTSVRLNYGLSSLSSNQYSQIYNKIVLGQGILQVNDINNKNITYYPNITTSEQGFTFNQIFSNIDNLKNCYVPGAIYLNYNNAIYSISFVAANSVNDINGNNLIFHKDTDISVIENIILYSNDIIFPKPNNNSVLLFKYIIDIEKYYNDINLDRYFINLYDLRLPDGLYGFNDEQLMFSSSNNIISGNQGIISVQNAELNNIKNIIQSWVDLDSWYPDFESYWAVNEKTLPEELTQFLADEMDIVI